MGAFQLGKNTRKFRLGAKVEFPIGKKLFHLVVNPGTNHAQELKIHRLHHIKLMD